MAMSGAGEWRHSFGRAFRYADQVYRDELREWDIAGDGRDGS